MHALLSLPFGDPIYDVYLAFCASLLWASQTFGDE